MVPRCGKQSGWFSKSRGLSSIIVTPLPLPPLPYFALTPLFVDFYLVRNTMETLAMEARKQPNGCIGLGFEENTFQFLDLPFFKRIRVSNHKKQCLTKINTKRLIVSWLYAYAVLSVKCHARSTKSPKWLQLLI